MTTTISTQTPTTAGKAVEKAAEPQRFLLARALGLGASAALLIATMLIAFFVVALPALSGGQALTVLTNSMSPSMPPGTLVVVRPTPFDEIAPGDIITYQILSGQPEVVTHRVQQRLVASDGTVSFITRGDNNNTADAAPVHEVQVRGTVWYTVPLLGWVNNALTGQTRALVVPLLALACFVYAGYAFISAAVSRRRARRAQVSAPSADAEGSDAESDSIIEIPTRASLRRDAR